MGSREQDWLMFVVGIAALVVVVLSLDTSWAWLAAPVGGVITGHCAGELWFGGRSR